MAAKIMEVKEKLNKSLHDDKNPLCNVLSKAEASSGVDRLYIFVGFIAVTGLWLVFGYAAQLVCNLVGFLYPAYASIKAIESNNKEDDTKWLMYWVVFAIFSILEFFSDLIVGWFPLYWLIKTVFFIWLMLPYDFNGATIIYHRVVRPYFLQHKDAIDETLNKVKDTAFKKKN